MKKSLNSFELLEYQPNRYPFLMVDHVSKFVPGKYADGYKNFTVIQCKIKSMEWLYLAAKGHRRARFDLENNKDSWLIP